MKRNILLFALFITCCASFSQEQIAVSDITVKHRSSTVEVAFNAALTPKRSKKNRTYTFTPYVINGEDGYKMPSFVLNSRRAKIMLKRKGIDVETMFNLKDTVHYRADIPYSPWMENGYLVLETSLSECCRTTTSRPYVLTTSQMLARATETQVNSAVTPPSIGDYMEEKNSFVDHTNTFANDNGSVLLRINSQLNRGKTTNMQWQGAINRYIAGNELSALRIYFDRHRTTTVNQVLNTYDGTLQKLIEVIDTLERSNSTQITHVMVVGFSSPGDDVAVNEKIAWDRALAVKNFLLNNTQLESSGIYMYNGGEDWRRLRRLVEEGDMEYRREMLRIIDTVPVNRGRDAQLRKLHDGRPYRYMREHYFPLCSTAFVKVYYQNLEKATP